MTTVDASKSYFRIFYNYKEMQNNDRYKMKHSITGKRHTMTTETQNDTKQLQRDVK